MLDFTEDISVPKANLKICHFLSFWIAYGVEILRFLVKKTRPKSSSNLGRNFRPCKISHFYKQTRPNGKISPNRVTLRPIKVSVHLKRLKNGFTQKKFNALNNWKSRNKKHLCFVLTKVGKLETDQQSLIIQQWESQFLIY